MELFHLWRFAREGMSGDTAAAVSAVAIILAIGIAVRIARAAYRKMTDPREQSSDTKPN